MNIKQRRLAGAFSFCLPGLGQVYSRRHLRATVFFLGFCILEMQSLLIVWVPLWALASSVEAFISKIPQNLDSTTSRDMIFATIASLGLLLWMLSFAPLVIPLTKIS